MLKLGHDNECLGAKTRTYHITSPNCSLTFSAGEHSVGVLSWAAEIDLN